MSGPKGYSHDRSIYNIKRIGAINVTRQRKGVMEFLNSVADMIEGKKLDIIEIGSGQEKSIPIIFAGHNIIRTDFEGQPNLEQLDIRKAPIKEHKEKYDVVICCEVLEHVRDIEKAIKNLCKYAKKGGMIITTTPFCYHIHEIPQVKDYHRPTGTFLKEIFSENVSKVDVKPIMDEITSKYLPWGYSVLGIK